jgi:predicted nucleic acid-binding protein
VIIADTGALFALVDRGDSWHQRVVSWWPERGSGVVVPVVVLPEVTYLLHTRVGPAAEEAFVRAVAEGEFVVEELEFQDIVRAAGVMKQYADLPLGFVDAAIVAIAERLEVRELLTTDRRHFGAVRPKHARSFVLLP